MMLFCDVINYVLIISRFMVSFSYSLVRFDERISFFTKSVHVNLDIYLDLVETVLLWIFVIMIYDDFFALNVF